MTCCFRILVAVRLRPNQQKKFQLFLGDTVPFCISQQYVRIMVTLQCQLSHILSSSDIKSYQGGKYKKYSLWVVVSCSLVEIYRSV